MEKVGVVVVAAGSGRRMGGENKVYRLLAGQPVLGRTLAVLESAECVDHIVLVVREDEKNQAEKIGGEFAASKLHCVTVGGSSRRQSVANGLRKLPADTRWALVHDGARPFVQASDVARLVAVLETGAQAAVLAIPVKDTIKQVADGVVVDTPKRSDLWAVQTPQAFDYQLICAGHRQATAQGWDVTDDCQIAERMGVAVQIVPGQESNFKLTTSMDWQVATMQTAHAKQGRAMVGMGYDVHQFSAQRALVLCGVTIPHKLGLLGHSDADVATHAIMDALLGGAGLGDIGRHFPDNDPAYAGADSIALLQRVLELLEQRQCTVSNIDCTIVAQEPKLAPYMEQMADRLQRVFGANTCINVKATTTEHLGFAGRREGIAAYAVVSLCAG